jgi:hypothetical protein
MKNMPMGSKVSQMVDHLLVHPKPTMEKLLEQQWRNDLKMIKSSMNKLL